MWYLDWLDTEAFNRQDHYLAQIAACVEQGHVKNPRSCTTESKLLKFVVKTEDRLERPKDVDTFTQNSKNFWNALSGASGSKVQTRKPPRMGKKGK